jgi:hypothetical protein
MKPLILYIPAMPNLKKNRPYFLRIPTSIRRSQCFFSRCLFSDSPLRLVIAASFLSISTNTGDFDHSKIVSKRSPIIFMIEKNTERSFILVTGYLSACSSLLCLSSSSLDSNDVSHSSQS